MSPNDIDPDLNLQNFNDHGIFRIEEINELRAIVKPQYSTVEKCILNQVVFYRY